MFVSALVALWRCWLGWWSSWFVLIVFVCWLVLQIVCSSLITRVLGGNSTAYKPFTYFLSSLIDLSLSLIRRRMSNIASLRFTNLSHIFQIWILLWQLETIKLSFSLSTVWVLRVLFLWSKIFLLSCIKWSQSIWPTQRIRQFWPSWTTSNFGATLYWISPQVSLNLFRVLHFNISTANLILWVNWFVFTIIFTLLFLQCQLSSSIMYFKFIETVFKP